MMGDTIRAVEEHYLKIQRLSTAALSQPTYVVPSPRAGPGARGNGKDVCGNTPFYRKKQRFERQSHPTGKEGGAIHRLIQSMYCCQCCTLVLCFVGGELDLSSCMNNVKRNVH